jgi:uncharacterized delta-60 repeat protein
MVNFHLLYKKTFIYTQILLICVLLGYSASYAQTASVDLSFNAVLSKETGAGNFALQPDGKILAFGDFQIVNGALRNQIARLNADGSLDNSFDCAAPACDFKIGSVVVQPDGKIYVAGSFFSNVSSTSAARIIRLNADGSLDPTFVSPFTGNAFQINSAATVWAVLPDGRILVSVSKLTNGTIQNSLYQLLPDGSFDSKFEPINFQTGQTQFETITKVLLLPNEKILVSTTTGGGANNEIQGKLRQYNSDGTLDATFVSPILSGNSSSNSAFISDFDVQADGNIVIVGKFSAVNSIGRTNVARLLPVGAVDLNFNPTNILPNGEIPTSVKILSNGKILVFTGGAFSPGNSKIIRLNSTGTVDDTFTQPANLSKIISYRVNGAGEILIAGEFTENGVTSFKYVRLSAEGVVNSILDVNFAIGGSASALAVQSDGKIIVAGSFTKVNGVSRPNLARLNDDGSLDETFNTGTGFDAAVQTVLIDADGKILVGGSFTTYNGTARKALARLNSDGSLDETFNAVVNDGGAVYSITLQSDGKIVIGGFFSVVNGQTRNSLARLETDGSLDTSFNPLIENESTIRRVLVQTDGKIIIGGSFATTGGPVRIDIARLNTNGSVDTSFTVRNSPPVTLIEIQADGKYLVMANDLLRLNIDGSTDFTFQTPSFQYPNINNNGVFSILPLSDGTVLIGGSFTAVNGVPRLRIVRLKADGSVDQNFLAGGANNVVRAIVRQTNAKILIGGDFTSVANVPRLGIARLNIRLLRGPSTRFDFDGDGRADLSVFRPSDGLWYLLNSQTGASSAVQFANATDKLVPADYDDDGKTDLAAFRDGVWYLQRSTEGFTGVQFGEAGDIPQPADFDADGRAELVVFRPSNGVWFIYNLATNQSSAVQFGVNGDKPVVGDYDGDGKADIAVYRPSNGVWYLQRSTDGFSGIKFGEAADKPVAADYDGDGKTDIALYRPSAGTWYFIQSQAGASQFRFGIASDVPVSADYDGDGKADVAVYRDGAWYIQKTTVGFTGIQFGDGTDKPVPNAFVF